MGITGYIVVALLAVTVVYVATIYNNLVRLKHTVTKNWSNIDVLLKQHHSRAAIPLMGEVEFAILALVLVVLTGVAFFVARPRDGRHADVQGAIGRSGVRRVGRDSAPARRHSASRSPDAQSLQLVVLRHREEEEVALLVGAVPDHVGHGGEGYERRLLQPAR
jgi:hypothetical protein